MTNSIFYGGINLGCQSTNTVAKSSADIDTTKSSANSDDYEDEDAYSNAKSSADADTTNDNADDVSNASTYADDDDRSTVAA